MTEGSAEPVRSKSAEGSAEPFGSVVHYVRLNLAKSNGPKMSFLAIQRLRTLNFGKCGKFQPLKRTKISVRPNRTVRPNLRPILTEPVRPNLRSPLREVRFGQFDEKIGFFHVKFVILAKFDFGAVFSSFNISSRRYKV